ncbi:DUF4350 domain-containing protein [Xylanimonas oleitrophica]|uniref:DUF4350 domain-containing protein n=2 Tax=Xylanimonas oleitrophica TaxID=2607479 RepID=A0A2W5WS93_9MICO|nr:DUF4350 domain-containing protein [Xylanimonas oleitrophica]
MTRSATTIAPDGAPTVVGDGTTARSRAARRWRRARWTVLVLAAVALVVGALAVSRPPTSSVPYAPDSTTPEGSRALAQVLERQGVTVEHVTTVAEAVRAAVPGTTLLVAPAPLMTDDQALSLAAVEADLLLLRPGGTLLRAASGGAADVGWSSGSRTVLAPGCELPAAQAAGPVEMSAGLLLEGSGATACYTRGESHGLVHLDDGGRTVTALWDPGVIRNDRMLDDGTAALALWLAGDDDRLVWLVQDPYDASTGDDVDASGDGVLPPWTGAVGLWALLCVVVAAVWRARRLGPLVAEDLPVVVPAAEATRGRGRLYRRARAHGHAAAALRAATADRAAGRLGVPRSADPTTLVDAVVRATGSDPTTVADLLYGPPPADDAALAALARRLDELESEVHRS